MFKQFPCACYRELLQPCETFWCKLLAYNLWWQEGETTFNLKLTQRYTNNWEANILLFKCTIFFIIDVPLPRYGWIYCILSYDKWYDVTIGNFHWCSCVYFVAMLALGGLGTYVQCKHVYHILQLIMFCGFMEDFIHYCMWNWDVVQCLL